MKNKTEFLPVPGTYQGTCPKCKKVITVTEKDIVLSGNPPEFPIHIRGHCHIIVSMSLIKPKKS